MGIILLAAFIGLPLIEIWVFIEIGAEIGAFATIAVCVLTAVVGGTVLVLLGAVVSHVARRWVEAFPSSGGTHRAQPVEEAQEHLT